MVVCLVAKLNQTLLRPHGLWPARLLCPWDFSGKNTRMGCHFLLKGIFPTQGWNPCLLHWQADSLLLSDRGNPLPDYYYAYLIKRTLEIYCLCMKSLFKMNTVHD